MSAGGGRIWIGMMSAQPGEPRKPYLASVSSATPWRCEKVPSSVEATIACEGAAINGSSVAQGPFSASTSIRNTVHLPTVGRAAAIASADADALTTETRTRYRGPPIPGYTGDAAVTSRNGKNWGGVSAAWASGTLAKMHPGAAETVGVAARRPGATTGLPGSKLGGCVGVVTMGGPVVAGPLDCPPPEGDGFGGPNSESPAAGAAGFAADSSVALVRGYAVRFAPRSSHPNGPVPSQSGAGNTGVSLLLAGFTSRNHASTGPSGAVDGVSTLYCR
jgi:hypothetical protein